MRFAVLIPAWQPDQRLPALVEELTQSNIETVVVDDGSTGCDAVFAALRDRPHVTLLEHPRNLGKGRALKTGIAHLAERGFQTAVTADADGQYTAADILAVAAEAEEHPDALILGARTIQHVRKGDRLLRNLLHLLYGIEVRDVRTGLRGIPLNDPAALLALPGSRYEYETALLAESPRLFPDGIREVPVRAVRADGSDGSRFRSVKDSVRCFAVLLRSLPKFIISSFSAFCIDYVLFNLLYYAVLHQTVASTIGARVVSATYNFLLNKNWVFKGLKGRYTFVNFFLLAACVLAANSALMYVLVDLLHLPAAVMKVFVEALLFVVNFTVQHKLVRSPEKSKEK